ncbi:unnamed protein product [Rotaria sp. Silwood1]|nr:unnamed protein product [Rotaria sp. Silwood1]CAF1078428.1 unnamed protein product [Rotaria sp. Silwood1]CAF3409911.1 unnamed protein product [Rotaria sp. Silwood1]CAF3436719.1 unnamed protein product [Rotaria sp. Silwood1]CAF3437570.1 unnamed protein product [Rotaria sp. Silwood1]
MADILWSSFDVNGISTFMGSDPYHPYAKLFRISSNKVTKASPEVDSRSLTVQANDERRSGSNEILQAKKSLTRYRSWPISLPYKYL